MTTNPKANPRASEFALTDEHRMLLEMRNTLYEGFWADFLADLRARQAGRAHVFSTIRDSQHMTQTISRHISFIEAMRTWEHEHRRTLMPGSI